jgi:hypothetical protein
LHHNHPLFIICGVQANLVSHGAKPHQHHNVFRHWSDGNFMAVFYLFFWHGQTFNVGYIFVSYVDIARIPFPGLEADLALGCFFLLRFFFFPLFPDYNFLHLPKAGILLHPSSLLFSSLLFKTTLQQHRTAIVTVSYVSKVFVSPTFLHTPKITFHA